MLQEYNYWAPQKEIVKITSVSRSSRSLVPVCKQSIVRHAFQHIEEAHQQALDLRLVQFVTANHRISQHATLLLLKGNAVKFSTLQCVHLPSKRESLTWSQITQLQREVATGTGSQRCPSPGCDTQLLLPPAHSAPLSRP